MKTKKKKIIFYDNYKKDLQNKISSLTNNDLDLLKQDIVKTSKKKGLYTYLEMEEVFQQLTIFRLTCLKMQK